MGGKSRIVKGIKESILKDVPNDNNGKFYDVFCGGLSVSIAFSEIFEVYSYDINEDVIFLWNYVKNNEIENCPVVSREQYNEFMKNNTRSFEACFSYFYYSFMSLYKGSYIEYKDKNGYSKPTGSFNTIKKNQQFIKIIKDINVKNYKTLDFSNGKNIIYCDPPYENTRRYGKNIFNNSEFWEIVKKWRDQGNYVYVSEKTCPLENVEIIFSKEIQNNISRTKTQQENLYKLTK